MKARNLLAIEEKKSLVELITNISSCQTMRFLVVFASIKIKYVRRGAAVSYFLNLPFPV